MKGHTCYNCKKLIFGKCPVCHGEFTCRMHGCKEKAAAHFVCRKHEDQHKEYIDQCKRSERNIRGNN